MFIGTAITGPGQKSYFCFTPTLSGLGHVCFVSSVVLCFLSLCSLVEMAQSGVS